jgi:histidinol-phosphate aminotransferase
VAALGDTDWFEKSRQCIINNRKYLTGALQVLGFQVLPSQANFVFARHPDRGGAELQHGLRQQGIVVRRFDQPRIADFLRITVGSQAECGAVVEVLGSLVR